MNVDHDPLPDDHPGTERVSTGVLPPLDAAGNSVRGQRITRYLSEALGLNLFASAPTA
jgi:glutaminase